MKYLNYGLTNISIEQIIIKAELINDKMKNNAHFPSPYPSLYEITSLSKDLSNINDKIADGAANQIPLLQEKFICLKRKLKQLGTYVAIKSQGNPFIAKTSGFNLSDKPETENQIFISA